MRATIVILTTILFLYQIHAQDSLHLIATITGEKAGDEFSLVKKVGDVNGDGYDDLLVSSPRSEYVKFYFGGSPFDTVADLRFTGAGIGGAGDVNGDGFEDILTSRSISWAERKIYLYFGSSDMDTIPDFEFGGTISTETLGSILTGVGDVNGDEYDDFIIGSNYNWYNGIGRVYLFLGGGTLMAEPYTTFVSDTIEDSFGYSGCGADINNDGYSDILIGHGEKLTPTDTYELKIYYGGININNKSDSILCQTDFNFGISVQYAGDINNDAIDDIYIASSSYAYIYLGHDFIQIIKSVPNLGIGGNANIGANGDINNDGFDDLLMGNTNYKNDNGDIVGIVQGYYGGTILDTMYDFRMEGETKWGRFSEHVAIVGDLNGDGYDEICISAPGFPDHESPLGKVYIYSYKEFNSIDDEYNKQPYGFKLNQNYPNPFNSQTTISYSMEHASSINLAVYNCTGGKVKTLCFENQRPGSHSIIWDGKNENKEIVSSGIYFIQLIAETSNGMDYLKTIKVLFAQ